MNSALDRTCPTRVAVLHGQVENLRRAFPVKDQLARFTVGDAIVQAQLDAFPDTFDVLVQALESGEAVTIGVTCDHPRHVSLYWLSSRRTGEIVPPGWNEQMRGAMRAGLRWASYNALTVPLAVAATVMMLRAVDSTGWFVASLASIVIAGLTLVMLVARLAVSIAVFRRRALAKQLEQLFAESRQAHELAARSPDPRNVQR